MQALMERESVVVTLYKVQVEVYKGRQVEVGRSVQIGSYVQDVFRQVDIAKYR